MKKIEKIRIPDHISISALASEIERTKFYFLGDSVVPDEEGRVPSSSFSLNGEVVISGKTYVKHIDPDWNDLEA